MLRVKIEFNRNHCSLWYPLLRVGHTCFESGIARPVRVNGRVHLQTVFAEGLDWYPCDFVRQREIVFPRHISWVTVLADKIGFLIKPGKLESNSRCHRVELHYANSEGLRATLWRVKHEIEAPRLDRDCLLDFVSRYFYGSSRIVSFVAAGPDRVTILEEAGVAEEAANIWFDEPQIAELEGDEIISVGSVGFIPIEPEIKDEENQYYGHIAPHSFCGIEVKASPWFRWTSGGQRYVIMRLSENSTVVSPDGDSADLGAGWWLLHRSY